MTKHPLLEYLLVAALLSQILPIVSAADTDVGLIGYFEGPCPEGWREYIMAKDRFIFSAGDVQNVGNLGGEFEHTLNAEEIPTHNHLMFAIGGRTDISKDNFARQMTQRHEGGLINDNFEYSMQGTGEQPSVSKTSSVGGGRPHNNMPPYIALKACTKIRDNQSDLSQYVKRENLNAYALQTVLSEYARLDKLDTYALKSESLKGSDLQGYIKDSELSGYVKIQDLQKYAQDLKIGALQGYARTSDLGYLASKDNLNSHITDFEMEKMKWGQVQEKLNALTFDELEKQILDINNFTSELQQKYGLLQKKYNDLEVKYSINLNNLLENFNQLQETYANMQEKLKKPDR